MLKKLKNKSLLINYIYGLYLTDIISLLVSLYTKQVPFQETKLTIQTSGASQNSNSYVLKHMKYYISFFFFNPAFSTRM